MSREEVKRCCYMAPRCGKEYASKFKLRRHVEITHYQLFSCEVCLKDYSSCQHT